MTIEEKVFQQHRADFDLLADHGFKKRDGQFRLKKRFFEDQFEADLQIDEQGHVRGTVVDTSTGMEYLPLRAAHRGAFAAKVYHQYVALLQKIASECFISELFTTDQANWLTRQIKRTYGGNPEFIFVRFPHTALFREPEFKKWYAVIADIKRDQLISNDPHGQGETVSVLNFRVTPDQRKQLLQLPGFYPAYGTKKKNWLSLILDGTQSNQMALKCVQKSNEQLTKPKYWIVPANPKYYDIMHAFDHAEVIEWKQAANIRIGDVVFMYVTAPVKAVIFACRVLKNNLPYHYRSQKLQVNRVMKIKLLKRFAPDQFDLDFLRQHGVSYIRGPRHLTADALKKLAAPLPENNGR